MSKNNTPNVLHASGYTQRSLYEAAWRRSRNYIDEYSNYGVGAALGVRYVVNGDRYSKSYSAHNIRLSGVQITMHAEQLALFQAMLDISTLDDPTDASLDTLAVVTTGNDMAIECGHCMQVAHSVANYTDTDPSKFTVIAADQNKKPEENKVGVWKINRYTLSNFLNDSYVNNRERSDNQ